MTQEEAEKRVAKGAEHLDRVRPGWFNRIDYGTLALWDPCYCIVGQMGRIFSAAACEALSIPYHACDQYGVSLRDVVGRDIDTARQMWAPLQDAWIAAIADRRLGSAQGHEEPTAIAAVREEIASPVATPRA